MILAEIGEFYHVDKALKGFCLARSDYGENQLVELKIGFCTTKRQRK